MELTIRLRARRAQLGLPIRKVSSHLGFTPNYYSAVENGRTLLAADKLGKLSEQLKFSAAEAQELQALRELAREPRWTAEYTDQLIGEDLANFYGLEHAAVRIRTYEGRLIPGLLQNDEYALALFRDDPEVPGTLQQKRLELRHRRSARLFDAEPLTLSVIMSQAAIMQQVGGPRVLRAQLLHLTRTVERLKDTLDLRIIPFESSPRGMVNASTVHLLEFASSHMPPLAWREAVTPVGIVEDPVLLDLLEVNYVRAAESALTTESSLELIAAQVKALEGKPG